MLERRVQSAQDALAPHDLTGPFRNGTHPPTVQDMRDAFVTPGGLSGWVTGTGPSVLLLHGGPGLNDYMELVLPELDGFQVASFQQRGLAPSRTDGPYDVRTAVADVVEVLDRLAWQAPVVIGHSWGGHLLLHLLARVPERVGSALVVDALGAVGD